MVRPFPSLIRTTPIFRDGKAVWRPWYHGRHHRAQTDGGKPEEGTAPAGSGITSMQQALLAPVHARGETGYHLPRELSKPSKPNCARYGLRPRAINAVKNCQYAIKHRHGLPCSTNNQCFHLAASYGKRGSIREKSVTERLPLGFYGYPISISE